MGGAPYGVQPEVQPPGYVAPQWTVGTRTQAEAQGLAKAPLAGPSTAQLQHDIESLALFARTLLTLLEEKNVLTRTEFEEAKRRLDLLDGKLDDR